MATQPADGIQVRMKYVQGNANYENVYHVGYQNAPNVGALNTLAQAFETWEETIAAPQRSNEVSLVQIQLADLASLDNAALTYAVNPAIAGTNDSPALPANATFAFKADIGKRGRGRSGRTYWIGLSENQVNGNEIAGLARETILNNLEDLRQAINGIGDYELGVISRYENGVQRAMGQFFPITGWTATDNSMDSQRNRLPNHKKSKRQTP